MSRDTPTRLTREDNYDVVKTQVKLGTPETVIEIIATQVTRAQEAGERVEREGSVVRDMKGTVIPHPAIKVEQDAMKIVADLLGSNKYGVKAN